MKTILIVDDDAVSVRLIEMIVGRHGYAGATASSAAEALAWLNALHSVEMVITDQNLGGMSGLELFKAIRANIRFRHLPVILCTGLADRATISEAMLLGIQQFIVKPITPKVVMEKVAAVAANRPRAIESRAWAAARLGLSDVEYKGLIPTTQHRIADLREEMARYYQGGDRVSTIMLAPRLREPAQLLNAAGLLAAVDALEATRTWHDLEAAVALLFEEIRVVENALDVESKPQLMGHALAGHGPDPY